MSLERERGPEARVIVIFPPIEDLALLISLRKRFDPLAELVAPHITLVFPFRDELSAEALRSHVEKAVIGVGPFAVRLAGITSADAEYLFVNVERGNEQILELHGRLYQGPLSRHLSSTHMFVPHVTVGRISDQSDHAAAFRAAALADPSIETVCRAVSIYRIRTDGHREVESHVVLRPA